MTDADILARLSAAIDKNSPRLARIINRTWSDMQDAITYKELRGAINDGVLSLEYLEQWRQDYSYFVATSYEPIARKAIETAAGDLLKEYGGLFHDPQMRAMERFISERGATLVREISTKQYNAINTLVRQASMTDTMTVDQLAHAIRPCVGLTERQTQTTYNYYDQMKEGYRKRYLEAGMSEKAALGRAHREALKRQATYAEKMHRRRAADIAQTELAYAYNYGCDAVVRESISAGYIDPPDKGWLIADDERVCKTCGTLEGEVVGMDDNFSIGVMLPPAHPDCRCAVKYILSKPTTSPPTTAGFSMPELGGTTNV